LAGLVLQVGANTKWVGTLVGHFCFTAGVNPVNHPGIFGNPAVAGSYGFVRWRDGTWDVVSHCHIY
jgi:hypothetical protein